MRKKKVKRQNITVLYSKKRYSVPFGEQHDSNRGSANGHLHQTNTPSTLDFYIPCARPQSHFGLFSYGCFNNTQRVALENSKGQALFAVIQLNSSHIYQILQCGMYCAKRIWAMSYSILSLVREIKKFSCLHAICQTCNTSRAEIKSHSSLYLSSASHIIDPWQK